ncbi:MAG: IS30 family transposase [Acutalibacteraceae bacterium]
MTKKHKGKESKRKPQNLGRSIEEHPENVENREEFGHWEFDTIVGKKDENEPCALVMTERMTRMSLWIKAHHHTAEAISEALQKILAYFLEQYSSVFKTITADNGSEFADLSLMEKPRHISLAHISHLRKERLNATTECFVALFQKVKA